MTAHNQPPEAGSRPPSLNPGTRARKFCFATFRFAQTPRFELVYLTTMVAPRNRRWLRIGKPGKVSAQLLGLDHTPVANANIGVVTQNRYEKFVQNLRGGRSATSTPVRTAAERPQYQREMEPRHDPYGGVFAEWPDPGGTEQPV